MGIKDNFSQAVKELWKKDGLEETGEKTDKPAQISQRSPGAVSAGAGAASADDGADRTAVCTACSAG